MKAHAALAVALSLLASGAWAETLTPASLQAQIAREGAGPVVAHLTAGSGAPWHTVIAHIASGQAAWLATAIPLRPGTDAGIGEELTGAVAMALLKNPIAVLKLAGDDFPLARICDLSTIEPTDAQVAKWKRDALAALAKVKDSSLVEAVVGCREFVISLP
jgi:hypothetical protein